MDWLLRRCSSVLIIITIFLMSTHATSQTENCTSSKNGRCNVSDDCWLIFIDGGFNGQIQIPNTTNGSQQFNKSICLFSFNASDTDYEKNKLNKDCGFTKLGVWLLKKNKTYQILINRNNAIKPICFVPSRQNSSWTNDKLKDCILKWTNNVKDYTCVTMTCLDPEEKCKNAESTPSTLPKNTNIISFNETSAQCQKGDFYKTADVTITDLKKPVKLPDGQSNNSSYSQAINNIITEVLDAMENTSSASLSIGDISGIFVKAKPDAPEPISMMYTASANFNIIEGGTQESKFHRMFSIPKEAFENAKSQNNTILFAGLLRIPNFAQDDKKSTLLDNEVFSIDMGTNISGLSETVNLTFSDVTTMTKQVPECHSWDGNGSKPNWTTNGCNTTKTGSGITCTCTHLTFFAVLMSEPNQVGMSQTDVNNLTYITSIGCGLSIFFLSLALIMHFLLRRGRTGTSLKILINLFLALFLLNFTFLTNESVAKTKNQIGCKLMAGSMHYSMLSSFQWFFLVALHLFLQLAKNVAAIKHYVTVVRISGWVPPAIVVTAIFAAGKYDLLYIRTDGKTNITMCWITDMTVHYTVNIGYYAIVFLFTLFVFVAMLRWLCMLRIKQPKLKTFYKRESDALTIMGLFFLLGLSWGFAFFAFGVMRIPALYIFTTLNSFQGFFLFIYYYKSSTLLEESTKPSEKISCSMETNVENPYNLPS